MPAQGGTGQEGTVGAIEDQEQEEQECSYVFGVSASSAGSDDKWIFAAGFGSSGAPILDSGAATSTCPVSYAGAARLFDTGLFSLCAASGQLLKGYVTTVLDQQAALSTGRMAKLSTKFRVTDVKRPIISLSEFLVGGNVSFFSQGLCGIAKAEDIEVRLRGLCVPLRQEWPFFSRSASTV